MTKARDLASNSTGSKPTLVDAKGDLLVGTAADTADRLAVGSNGDALVVDSSTTTGLRWQTPKSQNAVYNSAFDIWQRGTSVTTGNGAAGAAYTADRWQSIMTNGSMTTSQQSVGDTTNLPNIRYCARVQRPASSTNTNNVNIVQTLETSDSIKFSGQIITLSFYARRGANYSSASNALNVQMYYGTGTDQNVIYTFTGTQTVINTSVTLTTTWQRFSITATINAASTEIGYNFAYVPVGTAGAADFFEITGIQLETGSVATPYTRQSGTLAGELAACQRYYYRVTPQTTNSPYGIGNTFSSTITTPILHLPTVLRTTPVIETSGTAGHYAIQQGGTGYTCSAVPTINQTGVQVIQLQANVASGLTAGQVAQMYSLSTSGYIGFSAEL